MVVENSHKQEDRIEFEVIKKVKELNIKRKQVMATFQADTISQFAYEAVQQQFLLGKASVLNIDNSYKALQSAVFDHIIPILIPGAVFYSSDDYQ